MQKGVGFCTLVTFAEPIKDTVGSRSSASITRTAHTLTNIDSVYGI